MQFDYPLHLVGIKGSGLSALACLLFDWGNTITGSDVPEFYFTQTPLEERGITVRVFDASNVHGAGAVIYSAAYDPDTHPELQSARQCGIPIYSYPAFLGKLTELRETVCVAGSHGKTSTTSMIHAVWSAAGQDASAIIGDGTGIAGLGSQFILESCEYRNHFNYYVPTDAILLNIDFDHPDYFQDLAAVQSVFRTFAGRVRRHLVVCGDESALMDCMPPGSDPVTYGFASQNRYRAVDVVPGPDGSRFQVICEGSVLLSSVQLQIPGRHNVLNALGTIALAHLQELSLDRVVLGLSQFRGARRRFEVEARGNGILIDDYAHHPAEIRATLAGARERYPNRPIVACFQPHTYSRTVALFDQFASALSLADHVLLLEVFGSARERTGTVSSGDLAAHIGAKAVFVTRAQLVEAARHHLDEGGIVLLMGAGDINKVKDAI